MKALGFLRALPLVLLLIAPARADQASIVGPTAGPKTMLEVMTAVNAAMLAIQSCNSGASAPANGPGAAPKAFQCWADTSASPVISYKFYDGASWATFGQLNASTHTWTPYRSGAPIAQVATSSSAADLTTGTLPAARMPAPTTSTLGGVQSKTCPGSQWLYEITTGGVVTCAQPNFTHLAGSIAASQLPAFTGDVTTPAGTVATTIGPNKVLDSMLRPSAALSLIGRSGNTSGNVADISAAAGSSCAFRESSSAIGCGQLATAALANSIVTNAKLAQMANGFTKCRTTAGIGDPEDCTAAQMRALLSVVVGTNVQAWDADLDAFALKAAPSGAVVGTTDAQTLTNKTFNCANNTCIVWLGSDVTGILPKANGGLGASLLSTALDTEFGGTQGAVLYRNASQWVALAPGSAGQFFTTQGVNANPNWSSGGAGTGTVTGVNTAGLATGGPITAAGTVTVTAASKADQQAATSAVVAVTPLQQQAHPSSPKAWATWNGSTGGINAGYGVSSVTRSAAGVYSVNFTTAFASAAGYLCTPSVYAPGQIFTTVEATSPMTTTSIGVFTAVGGAGTDPTSAGIACYGAQ